jgi:hypothetical protein
LNQAGDETRVFIPFGLRKNCHSSAIDLLLHLKQMTEFIVVSDYRGTGISLLFNLPSVISSKLAPYTHEIIENYQCGFRSSRSAEIIYSDLSYCRKKVERNRPASAGYRFQERL